MGKDYNYIFDRIAMKLNDVRDKASNRRYQVLTMLNRTNMMFKYENLPESIPAKLLELQLQMNGNVLIADVGGSLYSFIGGLGGEPDAYYRPTKYVVANPALNLSKTYTIDEDGIVIYNDTTNCGLIPIISKYSDLLAENELTMSMVDIVSRIQVLLSAQDDPTKESAEKYLRDLVNGKIGVIAESRLTDTLKANNFTANAHGTLTELIEYEQYLKASMFIELGLNSNFNMKRESIMAGEVALNDDALFPLIDNMLMERKQGVERVNDMFGTDIRVEYSSAWEDNKRELDAELEALEEPTDESGVNDDEPLSDDSAGVSGSDDGNGDI